MEQKQAARPRPSVAGSASEFAPYLDLLPSRADLEESDVYYAGHLPLGKKWKSRRKGSVLLNNTIR